MNILALDIGKRRTGVAFADTTGDFVMALETIHHTSTDELLSAIEKILHDKKISQIVFGLPLLLGGTEGEQVLYVREVAESLQKRTPIPLIFVDERYTSSSESPCTDDNAVAACAIAEIALLKPSN